LFTQKHYEFLAEVLGKSDSLPDAILKLREKLKLDNKKFNESLFIVRILEHSESINTPPTRNEVLYPSQYEGIYTKY